VSLAVVCLIALSLFAQKGEKAYAVHPTMGPCPFDPIDVKKYGNQPFQNPPNQSATKERLQTTLNVQYTDPKTTSIGGCGVTLRSYNGALVGPTLRLKPGDTLDLDLVNKLPAESPDEQANQVAQEAENAFIATRPHSFNTTNLHTHGLHVSPVGNSDNVLLAIPPQTKFPYEIRVPASHPPGTFWYHAHAHGSTAIQVGSGMEGALVIEDDDAKIPPALREANKREKVMVFQTTLYDTYGKADDITAFFPGPNEADCKAGKSNCTWPSSNRRMTINGQIVPIIKMQPGEVQRWRMIDAAFRESIFLQLEKHTLYEIALDGLYLGRVDPWGPTQTVELQPGYRSDVLVKASMTPGTYRLIDVAVNSPQPPPANCGTAPTESAAPGSTVPSATRLAAFNAPTLAGRVSLRGVAEAENVVAIVVVEGAPLDMKLPTSAEMAPLAPFPGLDLSKQADTVQDAVFKLGSAYDTSDTRNSFFINFRAFSPQHIRYVKLGATDVWSLTTVGDPPCVPPAAAGTSNGIPPLPHVFHIHVNPFQATRLDPAGNAEVVWKDTVLVPPASNLLIYTQYTDYIGQFVMHCHILDHEDLGMMEIVEVTGEQPVSSLPSHSGH
jgi:FtsP/CotA-like multicopper oxidase with cupredoxin domain